MLNGKRAKVVKHRPKDHARTFQSVIFIWCSTVSVACIVRSLSVFLNFMLRAAISFDDTEEHKRFSELYARGLKKAAARFHPAPVASEECKQGERLSLQFQKKLQFQRKQMRDRAFAERCAARRATRSVPHKVLFRVICLFLNVCII